jgi:hypothetical protein
MDGVNTDSTSTAAAARAANASAKASASPLDTESSVQTRIRAGHRDAPGPSTPTTLGAMSCGNSTLPSELIVDIVTPR